MFLFTLASIMIGRPPPPPPPPAPALSFAALLADLHFLDLFESQWTELKPGLVFGSPPSPRMYSELAGSGDKIYVLGGNLPAGGISTSSEGPAIEGCEQIAV
jgi:hypothetical protein